MKKGIKKKKEVADFIREIEKQRNLGTQYPVHVATESFTNVFTFNSLMVCARSNGYPIKFRGGSWLEEYEDQIKVTRLQKEC